MNPPSDTLVQELKSKLVSVLGLEIEPTEIDPDEPLVGSGVGLDSIDTLELAVMVQKDYGVKIDNRQTGIEAFASVRALAAYIEQHRSP